MPEFHDLYGNPVTIKSTKLTLVSGKIGHAVVRQEGSATRFIGTIEVECDGPIAFSEIVSHMTHDGEVFNEIEAIAKKVYNDPQPFDRLSIVRKLQEIYFRYTGWHLTGIPFLKPRSEGASIMALREGAGRGLLPGVESSKEKP